MTPTGTERAAVRGSREMTSLHVRACARVRTSSPAHAGAARRRSMMRRRGCRVKMPMMRHRYPPAHRIAERAHLKILANRPSRALSWACRAPCRRRVPHGARAMAGKGHWGAPLLEKLAPGFPWLATEVDLSALALTTLPLWAPILLLAVLSLGAAVPRSAARLLRGGQRSFLAGIFGQWAGRRLLRALRVLLGGARGAKAPQQAAAGLRRSLSSSLSLASAQTETDFVGCVSAAATRARRAALTPATRQPAQHGPRRRLGAVLRRVPAPSVHNAVARSSHHGGERVAAYVREGYQRDDVRGLAPQPAGECALRAAGRGLLRLRSFRAASAVHPICARFGGGGCAQRAALRRACASRAAP